MDSVSLNERSHRWFQHATHVPSHPQTSPVGTDHWPQPQAANAKPNWKSTKITMNKKWTPNEINMLIFGNKMWKLKFECTTKTTIEESRDHYINDFVHWALPLASQIGMSKLMSNHKQFNPRYMTKLPAGMQHVGLNFLRQQQQQQTHTNGFLDGRGKTAWQEKWKFHLFLILKVTWFLLFQRPAPRD